MSNLRRLLASLVVCALAWAPAQPASPPASEARYLTSDSGATDYWPCVSPDGKLVLFTRSLDGRKTFELFVVPTAGGAARPLARSPLPVSATRASWSRQNNRIAFTGTTGDGKNSVWIINADGTNPQPVVAAGLSDRVFYPSWYPNGDLAVMDARHLAINRVDPRRGTAVPVTDREKVLTGMPSVSPDGKWIAFAGQKNLGLPYDQTKNQIWLVDDAGILRTVEANPGQGRTPSWSPDGKRLAFQSNRDSPSQSHAAFIINRDGTGLRQVTPYDLDANHPVWSPDGKRLVFAARHPKDTGATALAIIDVGPPPAAAAGGGAGTPSAVVRAESAEFGIPVAHTRRWRWARRETDDNASEYRFEVKVRSGTEAYALGFYLFKFPGTREAAGDLADLLKAGQASVWREGNRPPTASIVTRTPDTGESSREVPISYVE